ncbi:MAG: MATE family efflux transporter [Lachnospiraceae bacterium]|nr:MATE family efflux transporter [Lachnospiraceae bacterium]
MKIRLSDHFTCRRMLRFALPSIFMTIFTSIYSVVDGYFVSNFAGKNALAAISLIYPFIMVFGGVGFMLGTGGTALIALYFGEGEKEKANRTFSMLVYVSIVLGVIFAVLGILSIRRVAILLGATGEILPPSVTYGTILLIGLPAFMLQYEFQSFMVAAEKPKLGLYITIISGLSNMLLDWLFVGIWRMGIAGAAIATDISQLIGGVFPVLYFIRKNNSTLRLIRARIDFKALGKAVTNGSSEYIASISASVVSMVYNVQLIKMAGADGVAAYGVLLYVSEFFLAIFVGYAISTTPVIGYHYGARDQKEVRNVLGISTRIIGICAVAMLIAGELFAKTVSDIYVGYDDNLMKMTIHAFRIYSFSFPFAAIPIYCSALFTALNNGAASALISFSRTFLFQIASVLLLPIVMGLDGIWLASVVAEFLASILSICMIARKRRGI